MTNTTGTQFVTIIDQFGTAEEVLALHGIASIDDAREKNVAFGCFACGSIAEVNPGEHSTFREQADSIDWDCCGNIFSL